MKTTIFDDEKRGYVTPELVVLSFNLENALLGTSNEDLGDDEPLN